MGTLEGEDLDKHALLSEVPYALVGYLRKHDFFGAGGTLIFFLRHMG